MPWKDHNNWIRAEILAPLFSFVTAFLRVTYDRSEPKWMRRLLEAMLCGLITLSCGFAIDALEMAGEWKYAIGGTVGYFGADYARGVADRIINNRIDGGRK